MAEVVLEGLGKTYPGGTCAVTNLSLQVADGELLVLVGPSGCGKTTILRLLAGLETPTRGLIRLKGQVVNALPPHRRDVALVFQRPALYPHLTARQNLAFGLELRRPQFRLWPFGGTGLGAAECERRVREIAGLLRLTALLERRPAELSGGEQQRVALGRALARQPTLLLLDEPLSSLDARMRLEIRRDLHLLQRQLRATMVYVTHDQEEALALGDRVAVLNQGSLLQVATPAQVYAQPAHRFVAGFLGSPPMSLLDGELVEREGQLVLVNKRACWTVPECREGEWRSFLGQAVTLGVRPEQVRLRTREGEAPAEQGLLMRVELVERSGPDSLITLRQDEWQVTSRLPGGFPAVRTLVGVSWDPWQVCLFEQATGRVLSPGRPEEGERA